LLKASLYCFAVAATSVWSDAMAGDTGLAAADSGRFGDVLGDDVFHIVNS